MIGGYFTLILMLLLLGSITCAAIVAGMAIALLMPPRMTDGKAVWVLGRLSPGDLGLGFEDVAFSIRDESTGQPSRVAGWWIANPAAGGRCAILLHGYADAKVGAVGWAPLWHGMGFNILAIDLRAHGESDGVYSTFGFWERHDLTQVIDKLCAERPTDSQKIVLVGVNLGAAVAIAVTALRDDISAIVVVDPPADFRDAAIAEMDRAGTPGRFFQRRAIAMAERIAGCDFSAARPVEIIPKIACPIMMIATNGVLSENGTSHLTEQTIRLRQREDDDIYRPPADDEPPPPAGDPKNCETRLRAFLKKLY
jgi:pimeloyl-ACP methyl ester carboxylesterase